MKHTLESLFNESPPRAPDKVFIQNDYKEVSDLLALIDDSFYTTPLSAAKRIAVGSRLRHVSPEVMDKLDGDQVNSLVRFHETHKPLLSYLLMRREEDRKAGKASFDDYDTVSARAAQHNMRILSQRIWDRKLL